MILEKQSRPANPAGTAGAMPKVAFYPDIKGDGIGTYIQGIKGLVGAETLPAPGGILSLRAYFHRLPAGYDLIHVPNFLVPFDKRGYKVVCTIQDIIPIVERGNVGMLKEKYLHFRIGWSLRKSDHIVFTSENTLNDVRRVFGKVGSHSVIPLSMDPPLAADRIPGAPYAFPYCFTVGRRRRHKNTEGILRAFAEASKTSPLHLVFGGKEDIHDLRWKSLAASLGIADRIHFTGFLTREMLAAHYRHASCLVFPSLYEGFGLPILEAMSYGCPVITSNRSSMPEVAGGAALLVAPTDYGAIARALVHLEAEPNLRSDLVARGFENCRKYSWEKTAEATLAVYREVMDKGRMI